MDEQSPNESLKRAVAAQDTLQLAQERGDRLRGTLDRIKEMLDTFHDGNMVDPGNPDHGWVLHNDARVAVDEAMRWEPETT